MRNRDGQNEGWTTNAAPVATALIDGCERAANFIRSAVGAPQASSFKNFFGFEVLLLTPVIAGSIGAPPNTSGMVVSRVDKNSTYMMSQLQRGDIILSSNGRPIISVASLEDSFTQSRSNPDGKWSLLVLRKGQATPTLVSLDIDAPNSVNATLVNGRATWAVDQERRDDAAIEERANIELAEARRAAGKRQEENAAKYQILEGMLGNVTSTLQGNARMPGGSYGNSLTQPGSRGMNNCQENGNCPPPEPDRCKEYGRYEDGTRFCKSQRGSSVR